MYHSWSTSPAVAARMFLLAIDHAVRKMENLTGFPVPNSVKTLIQLCFFYPSKGETTETRTHSNGWVNPANRVLSLTGKTLQHISYVVHANRESWARWLSQNVFICGQAWQLMPVIEASGKQRQKEQLVVQGHA